MSDVLILGAGIGGLVAATYLARAGAKVTVLESGNEPGGCCANRVTAGAFAVPEGPHTLAALDPKIVSDLKLTRLGLGFAERDLPLVLLRDGQPLVLSRDVHETRLSLAAVSEKDAAGYAAFRRDVFAFARAMRPLWWEDGSVAGKTLTQLKHLQVTSAAAFLEGAFESEAVRAAFAFDTLNANPAEAGSALIPAWMAAQEICGLQGAVAVPEGGPAALVEALTAAAVAAGAELRFHAEVVRLDLDGEAVRGAVLASGEQVAGRTVLSSMTRKKTLLDFLPPGAAGFAAAKRIERTASVGEAKLVLVLKTCTPGFSRSARYRTGERLDAAVQAYAEAHSGRLPSELFLEATAVVPQTVSEGEVPVVLPVMIRPVPLSPAEGWNAAAARLVPAVVRLLDRHLPGLAKAITSLGFVPPPPRDPLCPADIVAPWRERIETPVRGLYLCGAAAEPVRCVSGRAGRIAAAMAARHLAEAAS